MMLRGQIRDVDPFVIRSPVGEIKKPVAANEMTR